MSNIVALAGTHGTSKSTLAYSLCTYAKKSGINAVVLDERARECPFPINEDATSTTQSWLILSHAKKELELASKYDLVISDRSVIDPYVYGITLGLTGSYVELIDYCLYHMIENYIVTFLLDKDKFDYCKDDGVRSTNTKFRCNVDEMFKSVLLSFGTYYEIIKSEEQLLDSFIEVCKNVKRV